MSRDQSERALRWVFLYCTWEPGDPNDCLPRPFAGRISSLAFNMLLRAVMEGNDAGSLPVVRVGQQTFAGMTGGKAKRLAATNELVSADLIAIDDHGAWTLRIADVEAAP